MELTKWISLMALWISASGQDEFPNPDTQNYQYNYFVRDENTGDIKSHEEKKFGDSVKGQYTVGEPTGDLRVVSYTADEGGFRANVKYEEGGSPLSDVRDKARQVGPTSGFEFEWLPGNPDNAEQTDEKSPEMPEGKSNEVVDESSESSMSTESAPEATSAANAEEFATESFPVSEGPTPGSEKDSSEEDSGESIQSSPAPQQKETESSEVDDSKSKESDEEDESSSEATESDKGKESSEEDSSAEAAESAPEPQAVPTAPSESYLPPFPMQTLPFYNLPMAQPPAQESDRPTIIYASQNFYNPWQWFGSAARLQREEPPTGGEQGHYMTGLGYIIAPPRPQQ